MILVLEPGASKETVDAVVAELRELGLGANVLGADDRPLVHVVSGRSHKARGLLRRNPHVQALIPTSGPRIRREGRRFYPYHVVNWSAAALIALGIVVLLAGFFPPGVGEDPDARRPMLDVPAPWYLRAPSALLGLFPSHLRLAAWLTVAATAAVLFLVPTIDRKLGRTPALFLGGTVVLGYIGLTAWGAA